jgi:hypothetical protein
LGKEREAFAGDSMGNFGVSQQNVAQAGISKVKVFKHLLNVGDCVDWNVVDRYEPCTAV